MITTPSNAEVISFPPSPIRYQNEVPGFSKEEIPGKGIGLIANRTIYRGEVIMQRLPTLIIHLGAHFHLPSGERTNLYDRAVQSLSISARERFMKQVGTDIYAKIDRNAFRFFIPGIGDEGGHLGSYPDAALLNHDCRPNVHYRIQNMTHITVAVRDISPGEELTISYVDGMLSQAGRQNRLNDWGFACTCSVCSGGEAKIEESDKRLKRIAHLTSNLDSFEGEVTPETGAELVSLHVEEGLHMYLGHAYTRAALNFALFGDGRAKEYAEEAVKAATREFGEHAGDVQSMKDLERDPRGHWAWGLRTHRF
ncbi:hypothetical protein QBC46DRAFT_431428 [Diplogelasinospora grovesii]|uniref:SET domain-containing protein n=1 Tax=Diplogelasinospora grovesii TaxID=303347 RepID=A0AAN6MVG5_9PEZI|nr:hypothetical protein QBC46DRAFT_431428 [Diplogelasinospora grovesii]